MIEQLFGSKTRVKLLQLFLSSPDRSFFVREITRKIDEQINSVRRELANLLDVGIITSESNNNKLYYKVNQSSPHFEALKLMFLNPSVSDVAVVSNSSQQLEKNFSAIGNVSLVILTGHFVQHQELNLDILIVGNVQRRKLLELIKDLEQEERKTLSYTVLSDPDFKYRYDINDKFVANILKHNHVTIIDKNNILGSNQTDKISKKNVNKEKDKK